MKTNILFCLLVALSSHLFAQQGWLYENSNLTSNQYGAICAINKDTVCVMADQGLFLKTMNGGTTWVSQTTGLPEAYFDLAFSSSETGYALGRNGLLIKTDDGGTTWFKSVSGTAKDLFSIFILSPGNIWVVGDSGVILHSVDMGETWLKITGLTTQRLNSICFRDASIGYIAGNAGTLLKTVNGGINWEPVSLGTTKDLSSLTATNGNTFLLAGFVYGYGAGADEFYKTNDNVNWTSGFIGTPYLGPSKLFFQNDNLGFCITANCTTNGDCGIFIGKTTDSGQFWLTSYDNWNPPSMVGIAYADIDFVTDSIGYALSGNNILKTTDGGTFVGVKELNDPKSFTISPNPPLSGTLNITLHMTDLNGLSAEISDMNGKVFISMGNLKNFNQVDVSNLNSGVYMVKLLQDHKMIAIEKLLK